MFLPDQVAQLSSAATCVTLEPKTNFLTICTEVGEVLQLHHNTGEKRQHHDTDVQFKHHHHHHHFMATSSYIFISNAVCVCVCIQVILRSGGAPGGVVFDESGRLFIADMAHQALLTYTEGEDITNIVDEYEDEPFKVCTHAHTLQTLSQPSTHSYAIDSYKHIELRRDRVALPWTQKAPSSSRTVDRLAPPTFRIPLEVYAELCIHGLY